MIVNTALRQTQRVSEEGNPLFYLLRRHFADHLSTVPNNPITFGANRREDGELSFQERRLCCEIFSLNSILTTF